MIIQSVETGEETKIGGGHSTGVRISTSLNNIRVRIYGLGGRRSMNKETTQN